MIFRDAANLFLQAKSFDGSASYVKWLEWHLGEFAVQHGDMEIDAITDITIMNYIARMRKATTHYRGGMEAPGPVSEETIRGRMKALRAMFNWLRRRGDLQLSPMRNIKIPQLEQGELKAVSMDDWRKMFEATGEGIQSIRDRALLTFAIDSGSRANGIVTLKPSELFFEPVRKAIVLEKGSKVRGVPFSSYTEQFLREWLEIRPENATTLFCALHPTKFGNPLTTSGLYQIFDRLRIKAGVEFNGNPHSLRHAFARECAINGCDINTISRLMGHSQIWITAHYYARFTQDELFKQYEDKSPLKRFKK